VWAAVVLLDRAITTRAWFRRRLYRQLRKFVLDLFPSQLLPSFAILLSESRSLCFMLFLVKGTLKSLGVLEHPIEFFAGETVVPWHSM
jgi:hypothetical protein